MRARIPRFRHAVTACAALLVLAGAFGAGWAGGEEEIARAVSLYDSGNYAEARPLLEAIAPSPDAPGPLLYRLYFCRARDADAAGAQQALGRARERLEKETADGGTLEQWFYLVNTHVNQRNASEARRVATEALDRVASKSLAVPTTAIASFHLGRLAQEAGRSADAARWFREAVDGFAAAKSTFPGAESWARRFLAEDAFARADWESAEKDYSALAVLPGPLASDSSQLAIARVRLGRFAGAAEAWKQAVRLDPGAADDARYAGRLAEAAAALGALPPQAPSGVAWGKLSRADLEAVLLDASNAVKEAKLKSANSEDGRPEFKTVVAAKRPSFVAAGLEYACRKLPLRETAFSNGYAVLVFQESAWTWAGKPQN